MAYEIEHKYLVGDDSYKSMATESHEISQGYLQTDPARTVRVRLYDRKGFLTVKGLTMGDTRHEYEYEVPYADAVEMLGMCTDVLQKTRYIVFFAGHRWEVDEFKGALSPLVVAEIELRSAGEKYELPPFVGADVTGDPRYYNSNLARLGM